MPSSLLSFAAALEEPVLVCVFLCVDVAVMLTLYVLDFFPPLELQLPWQRTKRLYHVSLPVTAVSNSSQALALCVYVLSPNLAFDHVASIEK